MRARSASPRVSREGGTSITRYIGRGGGGGGGEGWNRPERGAGKSSRAANCPPSYPPYTLSHTLARNHPYPPLPPVIRFPPTRLSHPTSHSSPPPTTALAHLFIVLLASPPATTPLVRPFSLGGPRRAAASKALDYLPLISARVAHLLPRPKDRPPPLSPLSHSPRVVSSFVFHLSSCRLSSFFHLWCAPSAFPSFLRSVLKRHRRDPY